LHEANVNLLLLLLGVLPPATAELGSIARYDVAVGAAGPVRAMEDAGVPRDAGAALDAALSCRVDMHAALKEGDRISLWVGGDGDLLGGTLAMRGRALSFARYEGALAPRGYYDDRGLSLAGPLRARPVALGTVTSRFGDRFHPLRGARSRHTGVDYGIPLETSVFAAGDGVVKERGQSAAAGNYIKLAHARGYESWYLHLARFEPGTVRGSRVVKGQPIARSGSTGRSTGPHVHYELRLAGIPVDPAQMTPTADVALGPVALKEHRAFLRTLEEMEAQR
jgi:murein DD-endopeptidase MepM/ murein hydrolase activator NlpD